MIHHGNRLLIITREPHLPNNSFVPTTNWIFFFLLLTASPRFYLSFKTFQDPKPPDLLEVKEVLLEATLITDLLKTIR